MRTKVCRAENLYVQQNDNGITRVDMYQDKMDKPVSARYYSGVDVYLVDGVMTIESQMYGMLEAFSNFRFVKH